MEIQVKCRDKIDITKRWLLIWSTEFKLSPKEIDILSVIIERYQRLKEKGLAIEEISELLFTTKSKKEYQKLCSINDNTLNYYLSIFKKKKIIHKNQIIKYLIPSDKLTFKFLIQEPIVITETK
jgi:hypothetical protein